MHRFLLLPVLCALLADASAQQVRSFRLVARPGTWQIDPNTTVTNGWYYNAVLPGPELRVTEGDTVRVTLVNELPEASTIHFHGLPVPLAVDGVPWVSQGPVGVGQEYTYEFVADRPGTYWYHPHVDLQIDRGLVAPLIVEPANPNVDPPFDVEHVIVLDDWLPGAPIAGQNPVYSHFLLNGRTSQGQVPFAIAQGQTARLRILNCSGFTNFVVTVDGHPMTVTHSDGQRVVPIVTRALPIGVGERYDVYVTANNPGRWSIAAADLRWRSQVLVRGVLAYQGSGGPDPSPSYVPPDLASAPLLSYSQMASAAPIGAISSSPHRRYPLDLAPQMGPGYVWTIGGQAFPNASPLDVALGEDVRFDLRNLTMHAHPMHLHGHFFKVLGTAGGTTAPLVKDTVLVPGGMMMAPATLSFEFAADNPGNWPFHCHMIYHMAAGMMRLVRYVGSDQDGDGLADGEDWDPAGAHAVIWTADLAGGYLPGTSFQIAGQWPQGESVFWFLGSQLPAPVSYGILGEALIRTEVYAGLAAADGYDRSSLTLNIPPSPGLSGLVWGVQGVGTSTLLAPGLRISRMAPLRIR